jgi:glycosyltransferase involved in cell wall biosynthesis
MKVSRDPQKVQVAVLWNELPTYLTACLEVLQSRYHVDLVVTRMSTSSQLPSERHPYDGKFFNGLQKNLPWEEFGSNQAERLKSLQMYLDDFQPQVVLAGNWAHSPYVHMLAHLRKQSAVVIGCMDNQWRGTYKQWLMVLLRREWLQSRFDYLWVPGERQAQYATRLGFGTDRQLYGLYVCDSQLFSTVTESHFSQIGRKVDRSRRFLFVGRFVEQKGVEDLVLAYRIYRSQVLNPWDMHCIGGGHLENVLRKEPGVIVESFLQPTELVNAFEQADVFILPSRFEPWGVVIHEAATVGLPLICSSACGAAVEFLKDGYNGFLFKPGDVTGLARLLEHCASGSVDLEVMGHRSAQIAQRFTPEHWADYLAEMLQLKAGIYLSLTDHTVRQVPHEISLAQSQDRLGASYD